MFKSIGLFFLLPSILFCQTKKTPGYENLVKFENYNLDKYGYIITTPKNYSNSSNSVPLFIFLHGFSLKGNNLNLLMNKYGVVYEQIQGMQIPGVVLAPQCHMDSSWSYSKIDFLIEWTKQNYRIDNTRIYILGMSMGGSGTWICGSRLNHKIAAMAPMCGGSYLDLGWTNPCALVKMPIWTFHGKKDTDVPVEETYTTIDAIKNCGGGDSLKVTYYPNVGHNLAFVFKDPKLYQWLLSHQKTDFHNYWQEEQTTPETNPNDNYNDHSNQSNFEPSRDENPTTPYSPPQNPVVEPPSPPTVPTYQPPIQNTPIKTQKATTPEASQIVPREQPINQPKVNPTVEAPKSTPKTRPSKPKKEKKIKYKKPQKAYLNETKLSIFVTANTTTKGHSKSIFESFSVNTGAEVEIPFQKTKRYFWGMYAKTGLFLYNSNSVFQSQINFDGVKNQNGYGCMPSQEIGFILFRGLKLGAGICYTNPNQLFTYSPYFSGAIGFKMDEYEIEFGSLAQPKDKKLTFYPSFTFKIRPIK